MSRLDLILEGHKGEAGALIGVLQDVQDEYSYLPQEALVRVAEGLGIPLSQAYQVATFYKAFSLEPRGKHLIQVCLGTACHVRGGVKIAERIERELGIEPGETTEDREFTMEVVRCIGCCSLAPAVRVDDDTYGRLRQDRVPRMLRSYDQGTKDEH